MSLTFQGGNCPFHPLLGPRGPPCSSWARSTLGLRTSLPSAVDVRFLALCVAHRLPLSKHHSPVAFPDLTGCRAHWLPTLPSTFQVCFTYSVLSIALGTSQHSAYICVFAYGPPPSDHEALPVCSAAGAPARGAEISTHSCGVNQQASPCLVGRGRLSASTVRVQSLPHKPLHHFTAKQTRYQI